MIIEICFWVGGMLFSILYNKTKNQIIKMVYRETFPRAIMYYKSWHEENRSLFYKIGDKICDWADWVIVKDDLF
jgi:hypothetical protein